MNKKFIYLLLLSFINNLILAQLREVIVPITNLKDQPVTTLQTNITYPVFSKQTPFQNTQLLFGEYVFATGKECLQNGENWIEVSSQEQKQYNGFGLKSIKGWIKENDTVTTNFIVKKNIVVNKKWTTIYSPDKETLIKLSIGTKLLFRNTNYDECFVELPDGTEGLIKTVDVCYYINFNIEKEGLRNTILETSKKFLDMPYSWGGRSAFNPEYPGQTSIDCSGFISLLYQVMGLQIPRNAKDQYKYSNQIECGQNLLPGDLIFLANKETPEKINHVLLYLGKEQLQESIGFEEPFKNRIISFEEKLGVTRNEIISEEIYNNKIIYLGSLLNDQDKIQEMRILFLNYNLLD